MLTPLYHLKLEELIRKRDGDLLSSYEPLAQQRTVQPDLMPGISNTYKEENVKKVDRESGKETNEEMHDVTFKRMWGWTCIIEKI